MNIITPKPFRYNFQMSIFSRQCLIIILANIYAPMYLQQNIAWCNSIILANYKFGKNDDLMPMFLSGF